jgi:ABC-type multidrug transport system fused ATPase/permease subunit
MALNILFMTLFLVGLPGYLLQALDRHYAFKVLGISEQSTSAEISKAYRYLSLQYHPDKCKATECQSKFLEINEAYEKLTKNTYSDELLRFKKTIDDVMSKITLSDFESLRDHFAYWTKNPRFGEDIALIMKDINGEEVIHNFFTNMPTPVYLFIIFFTMSVKYGFNIAIIIFLLLFIQIFIVVWLFYKITRKIFQLIWTIMHFMIGLLIRIWNLITPKKQD